MFVPAFSRCAMVWSRRCEYEADADAASVVNRENIVNALARLEAFDAWYAEKFPRVLREWQRNEPDAPENPLEREIAAFEQALPELVAQTKASDATPATAWLDTHPRLSERAASLGIKPQLAPHDGQTGAALFGVKWSKIAAEYNARWRAANAVDWSVAHARYQHIEAPLLAADPDTVAGWPIAQRLERARALRRHQPDKGLNELVALHAAAPDDHNVTFAYASARLMERDADAVDIVRALAKDNIAWRVPAYARLLRYHSRIGDRAGLRRWTALLERAMQSEMHASASVCDTIMAGRPAPTTRPPAFIETVCAGLRADPLVAKAWLVQAEALLMTPDKSRQTTIQADALVLILDAFDEKQLPYDADLIRHRHQQALSDLIDPDAIPIVLSFYATEALPAALQQALDAQTSACIYMR